MLISLDNAKLDRLLDYILLDGKNAEDKKACFKYPGIAAELLSVSNQKVADFFSIDLNGSLTNFDKLMSCFVNLETKNVLVEQNFTRIGYVQKVLNNLITFKPAVFLNYLFSKHEFTKALIANCHSKSIQVLILTILIGQNPPMTMPSDQNITVNNDSKKQTFFESRIEFFDQMIDACFNSKDDENLYDLHLNLIGALSNLPIKEFSEKSKFQKHFVEKHLELFLDDLKSNFNDKNDKTSAVLLSFVESILKEPEQNTSWIAPEKLSLIASTFSSIISNCLNELPTPRASSTSNLDTSKDKGSSKKLGTEFRRTSTYSVEIKLANFKLVKLIEVLRLLYKKVLRKQGFPQENLVDPKMAKCLISLFTLYPHNNILHFQILRLLLEVNEVADGDLFSILFVKNQAFGDLLSTIEASKNILYSNSKNPARPGYLGHVKTLIGTFAKSPHGDQLKTVPSYLNFMSNFFSMENTFETHCLGDVDVKPPPDSELENNFSFSMEEIKARYLDFLGYNTEGVHEKPTAPHEKDDVKEEEIVKDTKPAVIEHEELKEDMRKLDLMGVAEESAFFERNYWRPVIDFDVDSLVKEINQKSSP